MLLQMDSSLAQRYTNTSQMTRIITESWVGRNMFCPRCGFSHISRFENNKPVADFYCPDCSNQYELKSKDGNSFDKVIDGAYSTMIKRISSMDNPDFLFMQYNRADWTVKNLFFVPKHFFTPNIIEIRKPLAPTARRAGWVGCNILLSQIPSTGRIPIIQNGIEQSRDIIVGKVQKADSLIIDNINARGWLMDVLSCIDRISSEDFTLQQVYTFEAELSKKHPDNNNVRPKIRQQLQLLRDKGIIEFVQPGEYRKVT